jgi:branched-chain amino acid transport system substrate-binding protein
LSTRVDISARGLQGYDVLLMRRPLAVCVATGLALLMGAAAACSSRPSPPPVFVPTGPVGIGLVVPVAGAGAPAEDATIGEDARRGAQLAVDVVNAAFDDLAVPLGPSAGLPGLGGAGVRLSIAEVRQSGGTAGSPGSAGAAVDGLLDHDRVAGIVAIGSSRQATAARDEAEHRGVPLIDAYDTSDEPESARRSWSFRLAPTDLSAARTALELLAHQVPPGGLQSLAVLVGQEANTDNQVRQLRQAAIDAGLPASVQITVNPTVSQPADIARSLDSYGISAALALAASGAEADAIAEAVAALAHPVPLVGLGRGFATVRRAPDAVPTFLRGVCWSADLFRRDPLSVAVSTMYQRRFGAPMTEPAASAFTATITLAAGIDGAGSVDPASVRTSLRRLTVPATAIVMPWNGIAFGPDGQNRLAAAVIEQGGGGAFHVVFPAELAATPLRWLNSIGPGPTR